MPSPASRRGGAFSASLSGLATGKTLHVEREGCDPCDFIVGNKGGLLTISLLDSH